MYMRAWGRFLLYFCPHQPCQCLAPPSSNELSGWINYCFPPNSVRLIVLVQRHTSVTFSADVSSGWKREQWPGFTHPPQRQQWPDAPLPLPSTANDKFKWFCSWAWSCDHMAQTSTFTESFITSYVYIHTFFFSFGKNRPLTWKQSDRGVSLHG